MSMWKQEAIAFNNGGAATTITVSLIGCVVGNYLHIVTIASHFNSQSVADGANTFTQRGSTSSNSAGDANQWTAPITTGGTLNLVLTTPSSNQQVIWAREIQTCSGYDNTAFAVQAAPGTGNDILSSGNMTPSIQPGLVSSFCWNMTSATVPTAGTIGSNTLVAGSTLGNIGGNYVSEYNPYSSLSAVAATYSLSAGAAQTYGTFAVLFDQLVAALNPPRRLPRRIFSTTYFPG